MIRSRALVAGAVAAAAALLLEPVAASAHGLVGKQDLPIPRWLFLYGACAVLVVSFVALAALWSTPRLQDRPERRIAAVPRVAEIVAGAAGVALFVLVVYAGFAGSQTPTANIAPTAIYVLLWVGVPVASMLLGDVFRAMNPWRAIGRAAGWVAIRVAGGRDALPEPLDYPERLGRWPAAIGILGFVWVELVFSERDDPSTLATLALAYAAVQFVGMALYGVERWTSRGDALSVYFGLFARLAPLRWRDGALWARTPLSGITAMTPVPGTVALLCVMIGTTSFDGFQGGELWGDVAPELQTFFLDVGFNQLRAIEAAFTVGLVGMVLLVAALYAIGVAGMRTARPDEPRARLSGAFVHSLVPIALAYVIAHYFSLAAYQGQALGYLASDPLGDGSDLLGTASATIDYAVVGPNAVWYVQVGALIAGHVAGLVLAHDKAVALWGSSRAATRSQLWLLAVMVAFTSLGLWLLSAASQ